MIHVNTKAQIMIRNGTTKNAIGEQVPEWLHVQSLFGWLDLQGGDSKYQTYNAKIQESTHIILADYVQLDSRITAENSMVVIDGLAYDVMLIDDPMGMHQHWEIYLKYTGGQ